MNTVWVLVCLVSCAASVVGTFRGHPWLRGGAKACASMAFVAFGMSVGLLSLGSWGRVVFASLVFGAVGDLLLISTNKRWFLLGLVSFLMDHMLLGIGCLILGVDEWTVPALALVGLLGLLVYRWLAPHTGRLAVPVRAYILTIVGMVALAVGARPSAAWVAGVVLFFVSDLFVARERFVLSSPHNKLVGLPMYYVAQLMIAWGAAQPS